MYGLNVCVSFIENYITTKITMYGIHTCSPFICVLVAYGRNLEKDVVSETSGHFKRLLVSMCQVSHAHPLTTPIY